MNKDVEKILFSKEEIDTIVARMAKQITKDYQGKDLVIVGMLKGATPFMMDLIKKIDLPLQIDFMQISSYFGGVSSSTVVFKKDIELNVSNKHVIIVDDIIDTGITMNEVMNIFKTRKVLSLEVATLLDKPDHRKVDLTPKYTGAIVSDGFLIGYGLDYMEYYRNLPYIGILKKEVYEK